MAEPVGTALGALGLFGLLTVCLDCFNAVQDFTCLEKDFTITSGHLNGLKLRFRIWARLCGFLDESGEVVDNGVLEDEPDCRDCIEEQLRCIALLFLDGDKIERNYCQQGSSVNTPLTGGLELSVREKRNSLLHDHLSRIRTNENRVGVMAKLRWALLYKKKFTELNQQLASLIENLDAISRGFSPHMARGPEFIRYEIENVPPGQLRGILHAGGAAIPDNVSEAARARLASLGERSDTISNSKATSLSDVGDERGYHADLVNSRPYRRALWRIMTVAGDQSTNDRSQTSHEDDVSLGSKVIKVLRRASRLQIATRDDFQIGEKVAIFSCEGGLNFQLSSPEPDITLYDVMESLRGRDLVTMTKERGMLESAFGCLAHGLAFIHRHSMRNRDICPQNILLRDGQMVYINFGNTPEPGQRKRGMAFNSTGHVHRYRAPECQDGGEGNSYSDVFSLGCVYIEILTLLGEWMPAPLEGDGCYSVSLTRFICSELCILDPDSTTYLAKYACWNMVQRDPKNRWWPGLAAQILFSKQITPTMFFCRACVADMYRQHTIEVEEREQLRREEEEEDAKHAFFWYLHVEDYTCKLPAEDIPATLDELSIEIGLRFKGYSIMDVTIGGKTAEDQEQYDVILKYCRERAAEAGRTLYFHGNFQFWGFISGVDHDGRASKLTFY